MTTYEGITEELKWRLHAAKWDTFTDSDPELNEIMLNLRTRTVLVLQDVLHGIDLQVQDVGAGLAQIIPILVAILDRRASFLALEHPELHLHPRVQAELGDLLVHGVSGTNDEKGQRLILAETHSEHLLLRLLRRIRETAEGKLPEGVLPLRSDQIAVIYVDKTPSGVQIQELRVDEHGEFLDEWPHGFFDEAYREVLGN